VPQAFLTGLVDAMITSSATGVDTQAWDYLKHYYNVQAFLPLDIIMVNKNAFDALDAKTRKSIKEIAAKAEEKGWATSSAENDDLLKTMSQHGIHVEAPNAKLKQQLDAIGKKMAENWAKKAGSDGTAILAAFRK
jgi:TRAP-type C4-dicarboxylate transport system substrate-binding protein